MCAPPRSSAGPVGWTPIAATDDSESQAVAAHTVPHARANRKERSGFQLLKKESWHETTSAFVFSAHVVSERSGFTVNFQEIRSKSVRSCMLWFLNGGDGPRGACGPSSASRRCRNRSARRSPCTRGRGLHPTVTPPPKIAPLRSPPARRCGLALYGHGMVRGVFLP